MSLTRVILAFALAAVAVSFGLSNPPQRVMWFAFSGLFVVIGIFRLRKYLRMKALNSTVPNDTTEQM